MPPGRNAEAAQALQAKKAVSCRTAFVSEIALGSQADLVVGSRKHLVIVAAISSNARGLGLAEHERIGCGIVAVGLELRNRPGACGFGALIAAAPGHDQGRPAQVIGRVIRAQITAVAEDRAVLHQAVAQKDLLALQNVRASEQDLALRIDRFAWQRRGAGVSAIGQKAEHEEAEQQHHGHGLGPAF